MACQEVKVREARERQSVLTMPVLQEQASQELAPQEQAPQDQMSQDQASQDQASQDQALQTEVSQEEGSKEKASLEDISVSFGEVLDEEAPTKDVVQQGIAVAETQAASYSIENSVPPFPRTPMRGGLNPNHSANQLAPQAEVLKQHGKGKSAHSSTMVSTNLLGSLTVIKSVMSDRKAPKENSDQNATTPKESVGTRSRWMGFRSASKN